MPQFHAPDYADNTDDDRTMQNIIGDMITSGETQLDIASGFFEPSVWELLGKYLQELTSFRLLLGRAPDLENKNTDDQLVDLKTFYKTRVRTNLEDMPLNRDYAQLVDDLITFLQQDHVAVRYYNGVFLHAKAYISNHYAIVGSSNFTHSGMTRKAELNLVQKTHAIVNDLRDNWYESMWADSTESTDDLIDALRESKFGDAPWTPHDVFMKVLYAYFKDRITLNNMDIRMGVELASFQQEGFREAVRLIDQHQGVIVSDAVGLGKTYIGMSLLEHYIYGKRSKGNIPRGLVICPAQLRDLVWQPKLDEYGIKADVISQEVISRETWDWRTYNHYDVILIDEAHNFRNHGNNRYQNLLKMLATGNPDKKIILMTATPVNNSIWDLYRQVSLITRGYDEYFREYGIRNLKNFFKEVQDGSADIFTLLEQLMVRRSRNDVKKRQEAGEEIRLPGKGIIQFPDRRLHTVEYNLTGSYDGFYEEIVNYIESLALISFNVEAYRREEQVDEKVKQVQQYSNALIGLMKTLYLKRLESSLTAFEISIERQRDFQQRFYEFLVNDGKLLDSHNNRKLLSMQAFEDDIAQDDFQVIIDSLPEVNIDDYYVGKLREKLQEDRTTLDNILGLVKLIQQQDDETKRDAKLNRLKDLLGGTLADEKVLIFSYYQDTAQYIYEQLKADTDWFMAWDSSPVIDVVHGNVDGHKRESLVKRFAPEANTLPDQPSPISDDQPAIDILISTDVLSEGQNLQDAGIIINYDLHWTPIRMIQRAGRIDRLGTNFETLDIYNFFPQTGLENLLQLVQRLQKRIRNIDRSVGNDASILGEPISSHSLEQLKRLQKADQTIIDDLEHEIELVSTDEMKLPLMIYLQQSGLSRIEGIPNGIGSGIGKSSHRPKGIFFAFKAGNQHHWRLYAEDGEVITDKRRIYRYLFIQDPNEEPRIMPADFEVYDHLDKATQDVIKDINKSRRSNQIKAKMGKINRDLSTALQQAALFSMDGTINEDAIAPPDVRDKVQQVVLHVPLNAFNRSKELKAIRQAYKQHENQRILVESLDEFFIENDLYRDIPTKKTTLELIKEEDLELIAFEVFG